MADKVEDGNALAVPNWQAATFDDESELIKRLRTSIGGDGSWDTEVVQEVHFIAFKFARHMTWSKFHDIA